MGEDVIAELQSTIRQMAVDVGIIKAKVETFGGYGRMIEEERKAREEADKELEKRIRENEYAKYKIIGWATGLSLLGGYAVKAIIQAAAKSMM